MLETTLCYAEHGPYYLMLHRNKKPNDPNAGKWIGIGGKFEEDESPDDCLLREFREETGCTLTEYRYRGIITFVNTRYPSERMHLFTATAWEGDLGLALPGNGSGQPGYDCDEGDLEWVSMDRLNELPLWEGDRLFFRLLAEGEPFFSLKLCYDGDVLRKAFLNGKPYPQDAHFTKREGSVI